MRLKFFIPVLLIASLTGCRSTSEVGRVTPCAALGGSDATTGAHGVTRPTLHRFEFQQPHMGTLFSITLYAPDEAKAREASDAAFKKIAGLDRIMTDYDPDSELMQLCKKPPCQPVRVSGELFEVLEKSQQVAELSNGAFDVTVGPVVRLWRRARRMEALPDAEMLAKARAAVGWKNLQLNPRKKSVTLTKPDMQLDLGGIAKGFAADAALAVLKARGIARALVAASGDIAVGDAPPGKAGWKVEVGGLPSGKTRAQNLLLKNAAVSTSGDAEQFVVIDGKRYSHIVDPRTGVGLEEQLQVTIIARRATDTDGFATAVSVLGVERGLNLVNSRSDLAAWFVRRRAETTETFSSREWNKFGQR